MKNEDCKMDDNQGIGWIVSWVILAIFFSGMFILIGVGIAYALFCHFMGDRDDGQYICLLEFWVR